MYNVQCLQILNHVCYLLRKYLWLYTVLYIVTNTQVKLIPLNEYTHRQYELFLRYILQVLEV
jgi:hypothetical protein